MDKTVPHSRSPSDSDHRLPTELQFAILESLLLTKTRNSSQFLRTIAHVCRDWRDWSYETLFGNIEIATEVHGLRALTDLCVASAENSRQLNQSHQRIHRDLGSFIRFIAINIGQATGHGMIVLSDLAALLAFTPNLEDLCLTIVQPESVIHELTNTNSSFCVPSVSTLRIKSFEKTSSSACLVVARCPSLKHLTLELMVEQPVHDPMGVEPPSGLVSLRSVGCFDPGYAVLDYFVLQPSGDTLRAIELHRAQSPNFLSHLAKTRGKSIESITLRSMEPLISRTWETVIGQFTALQHLSVWGMPSSALLQSICVLDLRYFEFMRPWTYAYKDTPQVNELAAFLKACPTLRALGYHSAKPIEAIERLIIDKGLARTWVETYNLDGYTEDPRDIYAAPYSSWKTLAFPPPPPRMTKPRVSRSNFDGYDTSGWDLPIHTAKSDLFI